MATAPGSGVCERSHIGTDAGKGVADTTRNGLTRVIDQPILYHSPCCAESSNFLRCVR